MTKSPSYQDRRALLDVRMKDYSFRSSSSIPSESIFETDTHAPSIVREKLIEIYGDNVFVTLLILSLLSKLR
jgi:hypothetical protein